jgi:protocatechuate 3,4-dioxygenase beta subunit
MDTIDLPARSHAGVLIATTPESPSAPDAAMQRSDIRADVVSGRVIKGVPLRLRIVVQRDDDGVRTPVSGASVEIWNCDPAGIYGNWTGDNFLHGWQTTDSEGATEFITIYPGWYTTRTVHVHFKLRIGGREIMSELFFNDDVSRAVHTRPPYAAKGAPDTLNAVDCEYVALSPELQAALTLHPIATPDGGYQAEVVIPIRLG